MANNTHTLLKCDTEMQEATHKYSLKIYLIKHCTAWLQQGLLACPTFFFILNI